MIHWKRKIITGKRSLEISRKEGRARLPALENRTLIVFLGMGIGGRLCESCYV